MKKINNILVVDRSACCFVPSHQHNHTSQQYNSCLYYHTIRWARRVRRTSRAVREAVLGYSASSIVCPVKKATAAKDTATAAANSNINSSTYVASKKARPTTNKTEQPKATSYNNPAAKATSANKPPSAEPKETMTMVEPATVSLEECLRNLDAKLHHQEFQQSTKYSHDEKEKLREARRLLREFVTTQYNHKRGALWEWSLAVIPSADVPGVYYLQYRDGSNKIGMSIQCAPRVQEQPHSLARLIMNFEQATNAIPTTLVQAISALELPGLHFHEDRQMEKEILIILQVCELFFACSRQCNTNTVGERLFQVPSDKVNCAIHPSPTIPSQAIEFLENIPKGGVVCLLSWITIVCQLHEWGHASTEFLPHKLHPLPPRGGAVKIQRLMSLFGEKFGGFKDAITTSPRIDELDDVIELLLPLLSGLLGDPEKDEIILQQIREIMKLLQGDNYSSYVEPPPEALAHAAKLLFERLLVELPEDYVIFIEHHTMDDLQAEYPKWFVQTFAINSAIDIYAKRTVVKDNNNTRRPALRLVHTTTTTNNNTNNNQCRRVMIGASYFVAYAQEQSENHRFQSVQDFRVCQEDLLASGNTTVEAVDKEVRLAQSFLMGLSLDGDDEPYRRG